MFLLASDSRAELVSPCWKVEGGIIEADVVYSTNSYVFLLPDLI